MQHPAADLVDRRRPEWIAIDLHRLRLRIDAFLLLIDCSSSLALFSFSFAAFLAILSVVLLVVVVVADFVQPFLLFQP